MSRWDITGKNKMKKKLFALLSIIAITFGIAYADYRCDITGNVSTSSYCTGSYFKVTCKNHNNYPVNVTVPVVMVDKDGTPCQKTEYNKYIEAGKEITISFRHSSQKDVNCDECSVQAISVVKCN